MFSIHKETKFPKIEEALHDYFQGYLKADAETLLKAFHQEARLFSTEGETLDKTEMSDWITNLRERKEKGDIRQADAEVLGIDVAGNAAVAKVKLTFPKFSFTDYLSLLELGGSWKVINKIYSVQRFEAAK